MSDTDWRITERLIVSELRCSQQNFKFLKCETEFLKKVHFSCAKIKVLTKNLNQKFDFAS